MEIAGQHSYFSSFSRTLIKCLLTEYITVAISQTCLINVRDYIICMDVGHNDCFTYENVFSVELFETRPLLKCLFKFFLQFRIYTYFRHLEMLLKCCFLIFNWSSTHLFDVEIIEFREHVDMVA